MAKVAKVVPNLKLWIVGDAPASKEAYKEQVQVLTKRLGLWNATEFLGMQQDIPGILTNLDVLVLATTTHEAFGRVIIEAQASGVPVVATRMGGVIDVIEDGLTGLLVAPADPGAISEAVIKIFNDKELAFRLAENAYKKLKQKYNIETMVKNTLDAYRDALHNSKILIIKFSSLGDIILSSAAIRAIREKFLHTHKINFLVGEAYKDAVLRCPYIDEVLVCDFRGKDKGISGLWRLGRSLRKRDFDLVIDLQNNRKSHILSFLSLSPRRYGYNNKKLGFLLNERIRDERPLLDPVTHQFRILRMLDIDSEDKRLEIWPSKEDETFIDEFFASEWLKPAQKIVGINISASAKWLTKNWPIPRMARLCEELEKKDMRVVITGTERDSAQAELLVNTAKHVKIINACGKTTLNQLACLIKKCAVYISPDSASLHIAAAVGVPFVALFGPTDPRRHLVQAKNCILIDKGLPCSPCYKTKCKSRECMETITPEEVLVAIDKLLNK
jgi:lipopolysaccharide heptosyltransferase II